MPCQEAPGCVYSGSQVKLYLLKWANLQRPAWVAQGACFVPGVKFRQVFPEVLRIIVRINHNESGQKCYKNSDIFATF